jgi:hypothetical protein
MNERLTELINQVGTDVSGKWISVDNAEKLADLIIAECAQACMNEGASYEEKAAGAYQSNLYVTAIKQHFAIAEREDPVQDCNLHTCPYAEEIHGDYETLCDCDEERTRQCAMDV